MTDHFRDWDVSERRRERLWRISVVVFLVATVGIITAAARASGNVEYVEPAIRESQQNQVAIYTDPLTGCQYFARNFTPRNDATGKQICEKISE